jgi:hypothetical protein
VIADDRLALANRRAAYTAFVWVLVFLAWHVVWYVTGLAFPTSSHFEGAALVLYWVGTILVDVMIVAGCVLPLALAQRWGRRLPRWLLLSAAWTATGILALRGGAGVLDDLLRAFGHERGLIGLTTEQTAETSHVTFWVHLSGVTTDVLFTAGAVIFARAALAYSRLDTAQLPPPSSKSERR